MTLRNTPHNIARNVESSVVEKLYETTKKEYQNYEIVIIPDQDDLFNNRSFENDNKNYWLEASLDLDLRCAAYTHAEFNLCFATGPCMLLIFSDNPYLLLGTYNKKSGVSNLDFFERKGPRFNCQRPWATKKQVTNWTESSEYMEGHKLETILEDYFSSL